MALVETGLCKIEYLNYKAYGISLNQNQEIQLLYTMKGELVKFAKHVYRKQSHYVLEEIIEKSNQRIKPKCEYFTKCGGCSLQHLNEKTYLEFKKNLVSDSLSQVGMDIKINDLIGIPQGNRRRANFEAIKKNDAIYMGFHKANSNQIVNIESCPALLAELSNIIKPIKLLLELILANKQKALIYITHASNGIDIMIRSGDSFIISEMLKPNVEDFVKNHAVIKLTLKHKKKIDILHLSQNPYVLFDKIEIPIDSECFLQPSSLSDDILPKIILQYLQIENSNLKVIDLFCGRGTYSIPLSKYFQVTSIDSSLEAIETLKNASTKANLEIKTTLQDLFTTPITNKELNEYNIAIINPPRAGALKQIQEFFNSSITDILYISCNPLTFARDAKELHLNGYKLIEATPVDQFYWSHHIEILGYFKKSTT